MMEPEDLLLDTEPKDLLLVNEQLRRSNRRWKTLALAACTLLLLVTLFGIVAATRARIQAEHAMRAERVSLWAEGGQLKTDASPSPLAKGLIGTWDMAGTPDNEEEPLAKGGRLKFITGKHWTLTHYDEAGKVTLHQGGTCTIDGDEYTETVKYANESTAENIGKSFKFKVKLEGDKYTQTGMGNPYTEVWRRAK